MRIKFFASSAFVLFSVVAYCQSGITGTVFDKSGTLIGTNIYITDQPTIGTITDLNGKFQLNVDPGTYSVTASYLGTKKTFPNIVVKEGDFASLDIDMGSSEIVLGDAIVTAQRVTNTSSAVVNEVRESFTVKSGIDGKSISSSGASDAGDATKQIAGASVEEGKYMVVRGLGDRYSISQLNGVTLPSTDPYRNSASLDLIPTFMLDNIVTEKTFSPDQPGNFTGGNMDIRTKSFPEKLFVNIGFSTSYNSISNLQKGFLTAPEDGIEETPDALKNDSLGGILRSNIIRVKQHARRGAADSAIFVDQFARDNSSNMLPDRMVRSPLDHGMSFSMGNQHKFDSSQNVFGYVVGVKYKKSYTYYKPYDRNLEEEKVSLDDIRNADAVYRRYVATDDAMQERFVFTDENGNVNTNLGTYASLSYQFAKNHEIRLSGLLNSDEDVFGREQNGVSEQVIETNLYQARTTGTKKRNMANFQLQGTHAWKNRNDFKNKLEWTSGYTRSSQFEPDLRYFSSHIQFYFDDREFNEVARIDRSSYGLPNHFFRELVDNKVDGKIDYTMPITPRKGNILKFGGLYSSKKRDFNEYRYKAKIAPKEQFSDSSANWMPNWDPFQSNFGLDFERDENGNIVDFESLNYMENDTRKSNQYTGEELIYAGYGMIAITPHPRWKVVAGTRLEGTKINVKSADTSLPVGNINRLDLLPSANLIYSLDRKGNHKLRGSVSRTLARPNMRELAPFFSLDFLGGFIYTGNDSLDRTLIWNYDLSYQFYMRPGEMISVGAYYKNFINPIVRVFKTTSSTGEITFENLPEAQVYGFEVEYRKKLDVVNEKLQWFTFAANLSYIYSRVAISEKEQAASALNGLDVKAYRPFQGQSPYLANINLFYADTNALDASLTFNVFGPRLYEVGVTGNPDVYELPRPTLNFNVGKTFNEKLKLSFGVSNILDAKFRTSQTYRGEEYINQMYPFGRTFSFGVTYQFR